MIVLKAPDFEWHIFRADMDLDGLVHCEYKTTMFIAGIKRITEYHLSIYGGITEEQ